MIPNHAPFFASRNPPEQPNLISSLVSAPTWTSAQWRSRHPHAPRHRDSRSPPKRRAEIWLARVPSATPQIQLAPIPVVSLGPLPAPSDLAPPLLAFAAKIQSSQDRPFAPTAMLPLHGHSCSLVRRQYSHTSSIRQPVHRLPIYFSPQTSFPS